MYYLKGPNNNWNGTHYKEKVRQAGGDLMMYERYVDDSNQIGKVPPVGTINNL